MIPALIEKIRQAVVVVYVFGLTCANPNLISCFTAHMQRCFVATLLFSFMPNEYAVVAQFAVYVPIATCRDIELHHNDRHFSPFT